MFSRGKAQDLFELKLLYRSRGIVANSASVNTGPSMQMYRPPILQRPHLPTPHFIRDSSVVMMSSGLYPSFVSDSRQVRNKLGPPQSVTAVFSVERPSFADDLFQIGCRVGNRPSPCFVTVVQAYMDMGYRVGWARS